MLISETGKLDCTNDFLSHGMYRVSRGISAAKSQSLSLLGPVEQLQGWAREDYNGVCYQRLGTQSHTVHCCVLNKVEISSAREGSPWDTSEGCEFS